MKSSNHDLADSKGVTLWVGQALFKAIVFFPALTLSLIQVIKQKWVGGYFWDLSYASDCLGNVLVGPHANVKWIPENGYKFGKIEPISKALAINLYNETFFQPMIKWVKLTEVDKNHMAKTLRSHEVEFDQGKLDRILMEIKNKNYEKLL